MLRRKIGLSSYDGQSRTAARRSCVVAALQLRRREVLRDSGCGSVPGGWLVRRCGCTAPRWGGCARSCKCAWIEASCMEAGTVLIAPPPAEADDRMLRGVVVGVHTALVRRVR